MSLHNAVMASVKKHVANMKAKAAMPPLHRETSGKAPKPKSGEINETGEGGDEASEAKPKKSTILKKKSSSPFRKMEVNGEGYATKIAKALMSARKAKAA